MQTTTQRITAALVKAAREAQEPLPPYLAHQLPQHISASQTWGDYSTDRDLLARLDPDDLAQTLTRDVFRTPHFTGELQVAVCARPYLRGDESDEFLRDLTAARLGQPTHSWRIGGAPPPLTPSVPLAGHTGPVTSGTFNPDGTLALTTSTDHTARIWDTTTGQPLHTLTGHTGWVTSGTFNPDGTLALTTSTDHTARIWDTTTGQPLHTLTGHTSWVTSGTFNPDGTRILTTSHDGSARIWDTTTGQPLHTLTGHTSSVISGTFNPDGTRILTTSADHTARIWDAETGECLHTLKGHTHTVNSGTFNPTGTLILTISDDRTARIWSTEAGAAVRVMNFGLSTPRVLDSAADRILIGVENGFITLEWEQLSC